MRDVVKKSGIIFLMMIMTMNIILPSLGSVVVYAEEEEEPESELSQGNIGDLEYEVLDTVRGAFEYNRGLQLEMTKAILTGEKGNIMSPQRLNSFYKNYGGGSITDYLIESEDVDGDTVPDLEGKNTIYRSPMEYFGNRRVVYGTRNNQEGYIRYDLMANVKGFQPYTPKIEQADTLAEKEDVTDINKYSVYTGMKDASDLYESMNIVMMRDYVDNLTVNTPNSNLIMLDSYGNVATNNKEVVIPYWTNKIVDEFKNGNIAGGDMKFLSHPTLIDSSSTKEYEKFLESSKYGFYEVEKFEELREGMYGENYESKGKKELKKGYQSALEDFYSDKDNVAKVAEFIVSKTEEEVEKHNVDYNNKFYEAVEDGDEVFAYIESTDGPTGSANNGNPEDLEEANEYAQQAKTLVGKVSRYLDVGIFELVRLTWSALIVHMYDSILVNYSLNEIFHTSVLTDSQLWKNLQTTMLFVLVSFLSIYLFLCLIKYFMGQMNVKGIIVRFILISVAAVSPLVGYSAVVNGLFNKPAEMVIGSDMEKMFVLDVWAKKYGDIEQEALDKYDLGVGSSTREVSENYIIPFYTSTTVEGVDVNMNGGRDGNGDIPHEENLVVVDVSAFHVFEWLEEGSEDQTLFNYLGSRHGSDYEGVGEYEEYEYDFNYEIGEDSYKGEVVTSSGLLEEVYDHVKEDTYVSQSNIHMYNLGKELFSEGDYSGRQIDRVIKDISMTGAQREAITGSSTGVSEVTEEAVKASETLDITENDLFDLKPIVDSKKTIWREGDEEVDQIVQRVNEDAMRMYMTDYLPLKDEINDWDGYEDAEMDVVILNIYFNLADELGVEVFAKDIKLGTVALDTYVRSLFIPLKEIHPEDSRLNHVAQYVTSTTDVLSASVFAFMLIMLFVYGIIKFTVLYILLMPLILGSFFYNYVWLGDKSSKAWVGALGILGTFAVTNGGLILLWRGMTYFMNQSVSSENALNVSAYPIVIVHSIVIMVYIFLAFKFLLKPLYKSVKGDIKNLGGETMSKGALKFSGQLKNSIKSFWDGMSDNVGSKGDGVTGGVSGSKDKKETRSDRVKKDDGLSGRMNEDHLKNGQTDEQKGKDKDDISAIEKKAKGEGSSETYGETASSSALMSVNGLTTFKNAMKDGASNKELFDILKNTKTKSGKPFVKDSTMMNSVAGRKALSSAKKQVKMDDKMNKIENSEDRLENYSKDEMSNLEEMGMLRKVVDTKEKENSFVGIEVQDEEIRNLMTRTLDKNNHKYMEKDGKVYVTSDFNDEGLRKEMFEEVVEVAGNEMEKVGKSSFSKSDVGVGAIAHKDKEGNYTFNEGDLKENSLSYLKKAARGYEGIEVKEGEDGVYVEVAKGRESDANKLIKDVESKSASEAKFLGEEMDPENAPVEIKRNIVIDRLVEDDIESGKLKEGKDVVRREDGYVFNGDVGKDYVYGLEDVHDKERDELAERFMSGAVMTSGMITGEGGYGSEIYERGEDDSVDRSIDESDLNTESYVLRDNSDSAETIKSDYRKLRSTEKKIKREIQEMERMKSIADEEFNYISGVMKEGVPSDEDEAVKVIENLQAMDQKDKKSTVSAIRNDKYEGNLDDFVSGKLKEEKKKLRKYRGEKGKEKVDKEISTKQSGLDKIEKFRQQYNEMEGKGLDFVRKGEQEIEAQVLVEGQQKNVEDLLQSHRELKKDILDKGSRSRGSSEGRGRRARGESDSKGEESSEKGDKESGESS